MEFFKMKKYVFAAVIVFFIFGAPEINAASLGEVLNFKIDNSYDISARSEIKAVLVKTTPKLYFYIEKNWWDSQVLAKQNEILNNLTSLSQEFENKIYPTLTSVFGSEWKPGVDGEDRITVLFHLMKEGAGGYFRQADEYIKAQASDSNEREMLYLTLGQIERPLSKALLAHEFIHLITFFQKDKTFDVSEEVWLNEMRAEYAISFLGYDDTYNNSNLQKRVDDFLENPSDSLTEWQNKKYDYGVINLFGQYIIDHYGINILADSLRSKLVGISSIDEMLQKNGFKKDFSQIFTDWTIAVLLNNCSFGQNYCYLNKNLKNFRLNPTINFLPLIGSSSLSVTNVTKNWAGSWQKIIGGNGDLKLEFSSLAGLNFQVPYIIQDENYNYSINFLKLDQKQKGEIALSGFGKQYKSLVIVPSLQTKTSGFNGLELTYPFTFSISVSEEKLNEEEELIKQLLSQIDFLQKEIAKVKSQIQAILAGENQSSCFQINNDLYFGLMDNNEVRCLQSFLNSQGSEIYPEGLVTGNFGLLTKKAVVRFQEKYKEEILSPIGFERGSGFVGFRTRAKINEILGR